MDESIGRPQANDMEPTTRLADVTRSLASHETQTELADIALGLGVSDDQVNSLVGLRAVHADTWVHAVATLKAPWSGTPVSFEEALRWVSGAHGHGRGWTIRFEDGSKLGCVRRNDPSRLATFTPAGDPRAAEPSLKVKIGGQTIDGGFQVRAVE